MRAWLWCLWLGGCGGGGATLALDVKTDFAPGIEFTAVEVEVRRVDEPSVVDSFTRPAARGEGFDLGLRVREMGVAPGMYRVIVRLRDPLRSVLASRPMIVRVERSYLGVFLITRDCRGVMCPLPGGNPALEACLGGRCVSPECGPQHPELCETSCVDAVLDCGSSPACVAVSCDEGVCFRAAIAGACAPDQWCNPASGCEDVPELPDAGPPPRDAGQPAMDAGPPSCSPPCADDGIFCNGPEYCAGTACVSGPDPCSAPQVCNEGADRCETPTCGECNPGSEDYGGGCGYCGTDRRVCTASCTWGGWTCDGSGECSRGAVETGGPCPMCGTQQRTCGSDCRWGGWQCVNQGACIPGTEEWGGSCGGCRQDYRNCHGGCEWNPWECRSEPGATCTPGERRNVGGCACGGWEQQEECQGDCSSWTYLGCQDVGGGQPCDGTCGGDYGCNPNDWSWCQCSDGSWVSCSSPGSCTPFP